MNSRSAKGFNLVVYVVPAAIVALGLVFLFITIPRWRERSRRAAMAETQSAPQLDPNDAERLQEDLARHP